MELIKGKKFLWVLILLLLTTVVSVGVTIWALVYRDNDVILTPDYAPKETEGHAETIPNDDSEKLEQPQGGGAVSLIYAKDVTIDLSDKIASLMFGNPGKSTKDMVVQIVIQDKVIVQSGRVTPGNRVLKLDLLEEAGAMLAIGGYEGKFVILYYDRESGEKAILNTEIPITITVQE